MTAHNDHHQEGHHGETKKEKFVILKRMICLSPFIYPLVRVQTLMQSHLSLPAGESLPNFRQSFKSALNTGGLYKGFLYYFIYSNTFAGCMDINPFLGILSIGLFYPLEMLQVYTASNNINNSKFLENLKSGKKLSSYNFRGVLLQFLTSTNILFFVDNIKRNYILRTDDGTKTTYGEVFKSFGNDPKKLLRGATPFLLNLLVIGSVNGFLNRPKI